MYWLSYLGLLLVPLIALSLAAALAIIRRQPRSGGGFSDPHLRSSGPRIPLVLIRTPPIP